jgi:hypothetical protein
VRGAARVVRFEALCAAPRETLRSALAHCALPEAEREAPGIRAPSCYESSFSSDELAVIREETAGTARLWGFGCWFALGPLVGHPTMAKSTRPRKTDRPGRCGGTGSSAALLL